MIGTATLLSSILPALLLGASPGDVVARVADATITRQDLVDRLAELSRRGTRRAPAEALESCIVDALFAGEARRTGLASAPTTLARVERQKRKAALNAMLEAEASNAPIEPSELQRVFHLSADGARVKKLTFATRAAADAGLMAIRKSGKFEDGAPLALGMFGLAGDAWQTRGGMPAAMAEVAFSAPTGTPFGPFELEDGWAVIQVLERRVGSDAEFAARRPGLEAYIRTQRAEAARTHVAKGLRAKAKVTIDDKFLSSLAGRANPTASELDHVVATVNGKPVPYRDVEPRIRQFEASFSHSKGGSVRQQFLSAEIDDRLLEDAAGSSSFFRAPGVVARFPAIERRVLAEAFMERLGATSKGRPEDAIQAEAARLRSAASVKIDGALLSTIPAGAP